MADSEGVGALDVVGGTTEGSTGRRGNCSTEEGQSLHPDSGYPMKGMRKVPKRPDPSARRFPDTVDDAHRKRVKAMRCLIAGKRVTLVKWVGTFPKVKQEIEYLHVCVYDNGKSDPHHVVKKSKGGHDRSCVPLCRAGHDMAEQMTNQEFLETFGVDLELEAEQLSRSVSKEERT